MRGATTEELVLDAQESWLDYIDSDIFIINADGSRRVRITDTVDKIEMHPDWSPDGDQIVYNTYRDGIVYIISVK